MKVLRTKTCGRHGHLEFQIVYDPAVVVVADDAKRFLGWLQESVAEGARYKPGQTCQVGWGLTEVRKHKSGHLSLWEPDMQSMPIKWVEGVTATLAQQRVQKDVVESVLGADNLSFPSLRDSALICTRFGQDGDVFMERAEPDGNDSGWFCGCHEEGHDHNDVAELRRVSLYEAAVRYDPQIIPYLALPSGVSVDIREDTLAVYRDGEPLAFRRGSLLAMREARRTRRST